MSIIFFTFPKKEKIKRNAIEILTQLCYNLSQINQNLYWEDKLKMEFIYKKATIDDIDRLTEIRIEVLKAAHHLSNDINISEIKKQSYHYYKKALCDGTHIAYLVFNKNHFIGAGI